MNHGTTFRDFREPTPSLEELNRRAAARMKELSAVEEERQREYDAGLERVRATGQKLFDEQEAKRQAERDAIEAERAKQAAASVAAARERAEAELRRVGTPEADVARLADAAMDGWRVEQARAAAERGDREHEQIKDFFRNRPAPSINEPAG